MKFFKLAIVITLLLTIDFKTAFPQENAFESNIFKIGIVTSDLHATLDFYINIIGLIKVREFDIDSVTSYKFGLTKGIPFHVVSLKTENTPQATELKIVSFGKTTNNNKPQYLQFTSGVQFMTISVKSITQFVKRLKDNNIKLLGETPTLIKLLNETPVSPLSGDGRQLVLIQDPNGIFIEIIGKK
jgi:catechol 2,3-dioxygenase-like lactoylglutathione lyase family enzyme